MDLYLFNSIDLFNNDLIIQIKIYLFQNLNIYYFYLFLYLFNIINFIYIIIKYLN